MKRRVLSKTASFHPLFIKKKTQNGAVLNNTVCLLLPLDVQKTGEGAFVPLFSPTYFHRHLSLKKTPTNLAQSFPRVGEKGGDLFLG
jgi:hypothetical protein